MIEMLGRSRAHRRAVRKEARRWRPLVFVGMGAALLCLAWLSADREGGGIGDSVTDAALGQHSGRRLSSATSTCPQGQAMALPYFLIVLFCFLGLAIVCDEPVFGEA